MRNPYWYAAAVILAGVAPAAADIASVEAAARSAAVRSAAVGVHGGGGGPAPVRRAPLATRYSAQDPQGLCLSFDCKGTGGLTTGAGRGATLLRCRGCREPPSTREFCRPRAEGGLFPVHDGWVALAAGSAKMPLGSILRKGQSARFDDPSWEVYRQMGEGGGVLPAMDLTGCRPLPAVGGGSQFEDSGRVRLHFLSFAGVPELAKPAALAVSPTITVASGGRRGAGPAALELKRRKVLKLFSQQARFKALDGLVASHSAIFDVTTPPDDVAAVFETRLQCQDKKCDVSSYYGCYTVLCERLSAEEMQAQLVFEEVKAADRKKIEAALEAAKVERANKVQEEANRQRLREIEEEKRRAEEEARARAAEEDEDMQRKIAEHDAWIRAEKQRLADFNFRRQQQVIKQAAVEQGYEPAADSVLSAGLSGAGSSRPPSQPRGDPWLAQHLDPAQRLGAPAPARPAPSKPQWVKKSSPQG